MIAVFSRVPFPRKQWLALAMLAVFAPFCLPAAIWINEFMAAPSERKLTWDADGVPSIGTGVRWNTNDFRDLDWGELVLPAGYGLTGLATDLTSRMRDKAPSLYLRKFFSVTPAQIAENRSLVLQVQFNDGFVAYLNGREVARANCGPTNHLMFSSQPAYNVSTNGTNTVEFALGNLTSWLRPGPNLLAIQAHNADKPSTTSWPEQIIAHIQTTDFRINSGLYIADGTNAAFNLITLGAPGGTWRYFVGRSEPSGGVADIGLITKPFAPPKGEEDDFEEPAAFYDWVELHNTEASAVNLSGWSLTDDTSQPRKWLFPTNASISAEGFLLVLCDQREEANTPAAGAYFLHANFKLDAEGEPLALFDNFGNYVDGLPSRYPQQGPSASYGRNPQNPAEFGFLSLATPGAPNCGTFCPLQVANPSFEDATGAPLPGGIYTQALTLRLTSQTAGSTIRYTLNGSEPTEFSGIDFTNPLALIQLNEKTGIVVRARAFLPGALPSEVVTHTYLTRQAASLSKAPAIFLSGDPGRVFYAPDGVLAIVGGSYFNGEWWQAGGIRSYNNIIGAGRPYEREAHFEYYFPPGFYPQGQPPIRRDVGLRFSGSNWQRPRVKVSSINSSPWPTSDPMQKPSFNLYFNSEHGGDLQYPILTNYPVQNFQHLRLRAGKNDNRNPFITDELMRRLYIDMGNVGAKGMFTSLYVNGIYKGIYNVAERIREPFFQQHYQSKEQWDVCYIYDWVDGDNIAYGQLLTYLDRNLTNLTNWQIVTNRIDIDNAADYYLLNIYGATWDWPGNNFGFARERSTGPNSRFRFVVWDAEGAFYAINYGKTVTYNTLASDLLVPGSTQDLPRIFRRLCSSPEFRLRFADRVNLHMFNGGVLDDRDPDGTGPYKSHFRKRIDELVQEAGDLVRYNTGGSISMSAFNIWTSALSGRRTWLLGNTTAHQMLRDAGLWPVTEPPVFSQHGGIVPMGYALSINSSLAVPGQTATIYLTIDGTDPRLTGGARSTNSVAYTSPINLTRVSTILARAKNDTTGEWSPLTRATFVPSPEPASSSNLVIAELMYHPPNPTASELGAGFADSDDFEFVRLMNIGTAPVDLQGVRFAAGIALDFTSAAVRYVNPGESVLLVRNPEAFQARYGKGPGATIAGAFSGTLANSGERLLLVDANGQTLREFIYADQAPWPVAADGKGPSLLLREPFANPDHANPANWTCSATPGGMPGGAVLPQTYLTWRSLCWIPAAATNDAISGTSVDTDHDGLNNLVEYALGLSPTTPSALPEVSVGIVHLDGQPHLTISLSLAESATEAKIGWEESDDLKAWSLMPVGLRLLETARAFDGTARSTFMDPVPLGSAARKFFRPVVSGPAP